MFRQTVIVYEMFNDEFFTLIMEHLKQLTAFFWAEDSRDLLDLIA